MKKDKPSATASLILKVVLFASRDRQYQQFISPETKVWSERIAKEVLSFPKLFFLFISNYFFRFFIKMIEKILNPGFILHVILRKKYIEKLTVKSISDGYTQIIVLGSGYDTFSLKMSVHNPEIMLFDIDHPNTQKHKLAFYNSIKQPNNLKFIAADLSEQSLKVLLEQEQFFDANKNTLVIIEGVLMYIEEKNVYILLNSLIKLFNSNLQCIFTFMDENPDGSFQFKTAHFLVNWWLKQKNENFLWGIEKNNLPSLMNRLGFEDVMIVGKNEFLKEYFSDKCVESDLAEGEYICYASKIYAKRNGE